MQLQVRLGALVVASLALACLALACATSPLGRTQLRMFPEAEIDAMGAAAFQKMEQETPRSRDARADALVRCVANATTGQVPGGGSWEVVVFQDDTANAFALPGRKIGVLTGLLHVTQTPDQLAAVIGHEISHVVAGHANERVSTAYAAQLGASALAGLFAGGSPAAQERAMAVLGMGAQYGVVLPFGRAQEREADLLGLDYMARAGFDPRQAIALWRNMERAAGAQPPEFLSTHPSSQTRIAELSQRMPSALRLYEQARAAGRSPGC